MIESNADLPVHGNLLVERTALKGAALYDADGRAIGHFGEAPELTPATARKTGVTKQRRADGERYEVLWLAVETGLPVTVVGRLDSEEMADDGDHAGLVHVSQAVHRSIIATLKSRSAAHEERHVG